MIGILVDFLCISHKDLTKRSRGKQWGSEMQYMVSSLAFSWRDLIVISRKLKSHMLISKHSLPSTWIPAWVTEVAWIHGQVMDDEVRSTWNQILILSFKSHELASWLDAVPYSENLDGIILHRWFWLSYHKDLWENSKESLQIIDSKILRSRQLSHPVGHQWEKGLSFLSSQGMYYTM
jgi:hypothetical protein